MKKEKTMRRLGWMTLLLLVLAVTPGCGAMDVLRVVSRLGGSGGSGWSSGVSSFDLYGYDLRP